MTIYQRRDGNLADFVRDAEETLECLKAPIDDLYLAATIHDSDTITTTIPITRSAEYDEDAFKDNVVESIRYIFSENDKLQEFLIPKEVREQLLHTGIHYSKSSIKDLVEIVRVHTLDKGRVVYHLVINNLDVSDYVSRVSSLREVVYDLANSELPVNSKGMIKITVSDSCRNKYFAANDKLFLRIINRIYDAFDLTIDRIYHTKTSIEIHHD